MLRDTAPTQRPFWELRRVMNIRKDDEAIVVKEQVKSSRQFSNWRKMHRVLVSRVSRWVFLGSSRLQHGLLGVFHKRLVQSHAVTSPSPPSSRLPHSCYVMARHLRLLQRSTRHSANTFILCRTHPRTLTIFTRRTVYDDHHVHAPRRIRNNLPCRPRRRRACIAYHAHREQVGDREGERGCVRRMC